MVIPASFLIVLLAPSQPTTTGPVNVCSSPATRACTRTDPVGPVGSAVTGLAVPSSPVTSAPRRNVISGCRSTWANISSSRSGWWNMFACGKPCWLAWCSRLELGHHAVAGVQQAQPAAGPGPGQESLAHPDPVQGPGDLVVQVDRAGQGVGLGVALQQGDGDPEIGEQEGNGTAGRSCAHGDDGFLGGGVLVVHGRVPFSALAIRVTVPASSA